MLDGLKFLFYFNTMCWTFFIFVCCKIFHKMIQMFKHNMLTIIMMNIYVLLVSNRLGAQLLKVLSHYIV